MKALVAAHAAAEQFLVGYRGKKRYVKLTADFSGTHGTRNADRLEVVGSGSGLIFTGARSRYGAPSFK